MNIEDIIIGFGIGLVVVDWGETIITFGGLFIVFFMVVIQSIRTIFNEVDVKKKK